MKDFIECTMTDNGGKMSIVISSISFVEEYLNQTCRICLKEKVEIDKDVNVVVILSLPIWSIKKMIEDSLLNFDL